MFCTSCGADLGARSLKFCLQCGVLLQAEDVLAPSPPADTLSYQDNEPTVLLTPRTSGLPQESFLAPAPSPQPDTPVTTSIAQTPVFSGNETQPGHRRKKRKHKKARGRTKPSTQTPETNVDAPIDPFIPSFPTPSIAADTVQNEPTLREPVLHFSDEPIPPVSLEWSDRIVVEPSDSGTSSVPVQVFRNGIGILPGMLGITAIFLIALLFWGWNSEETDPFPEDADVSLTRPPSELQPNARSSASTPDSPAKGAPISGPKSEPESEPEPELELEPELDSESESAELMNIPSLPMNQQGRHNRSSLDESDIESSPLSPLPIPAPPSLSNWE